jgi:hypothetical protein
MELSQLIGTIILVLVATVFIVWQIQKQGLRGTIIQLIAMAESMYAKGDNAHKFDYVYNKIYSLLPAAFRVLVTEAEIKAFIQKVFDEIKVALDCKAPE